LAFNYWPAASETRRYGGDRLLTNFCYPRERQRKCPCVFHPGLCDSVLDWRVGPRLFTAFDPPNFPQAVQSSKLSLIGPQRGPVKISEEIVDM
jgi:hypothetical protein